MSPDTPPSRRRTKYFDADNSTNHNGTPRHRINIAEADQAESYRAIARVLGIDAADREAVERRVKELLPSKGHDVADFYDESED